MSKLGATAVTTTATFSVDSNVFVKSPKKSWIPGIVRAHDARRNTYTVIDEDGDEVANAPDSNVTLCRNDLLNEGIDPVVHDLLFLSMLHDATLLRCLRMRYMKDIIYTNIGAIVVALNPFNFKIPWYLDEMMKKYLVEGEVIRVNLPHSWAVAHNTFYEMVNEKRPQTILVSGESGAGKTEACKMVMKYFGEISNTRATDAQKQAAEDIRVKILQSSPILEGFGNAKTVRNNNSSRFGKFVKIRWDSTGVLLGAFTINYLLEKSRIVTASPQERVYHALYQVCKGRDKDLYRLQAPKDYRSTNAGGCTAIEGEDDSKDYDACVQAMDVLGIDATTREQLWRTVAGCLIAQNIELQALDADTTAVSAKGRPFLEQTCAAWGIAPADYERELLTTTSSVRGETYVIKHKLAQANDMRDSVTKHMYERLFLDLIARINTSTAGTDSDNENLWIGLLDIFGFEDFEFNSFEQLCINLANESLQNHYNNYIFKRDLEECRAEGIQVDDFNCPDNMPCLKLVTDSSGIMGLLDEECTLQTGTDETFLAKVTQHCSANPFFERKPIMKSSFVVKHYAGNVVYTIGGWVEKNRDTLKDDLKRLMRGGTNPYSATLLPAPVERVGRAPTVGGFFKAQVVELMALINSTNPHWIRCIKPHPAKKPRMFDGVTVTNQLSSSGVLGTVKIRKAGFPVRIHYAQFISRFKILCGRPPEGANLAAQQDYCRKVLRVINASPRVAQLGKTRVFLKSETYFELERALEQAGVKHRLLLQAAARAKLAELAARKLRWEVNATVIQAELRDYMRRSAADRAARRRAREAFIAAQAQARQDMYDEAMLAVRDTEDEFDTELMALYRRRAEGARAIEERERRHREERTILADREVRARAAIARENVNAFSFIRMLALPLVEVQRRRALLLSEAVEWDRLFFWLRCASVDFLERRARRLLTRLEALQRVELEERRRLLPLFESSLQLDVRTFRDVLQDTKHQAVLLAQRRAHRDVMRMEHNDEVQFSARHGRDDAKVDRLLARMDLGRRVVADTGYRRTGETQHKVSSFASAEPWRGPQGVPDIDQVLAGIRDTRAQERKAERADRYTATRQASQHVLEQRQMRRLSSTSPQRAASLGMGSPSMSGSLTARRRSMAPGASGYGSPSSASALASATAVNAFKRTGVFENFASTDDEVRFLRMRHVLALEYQALIREEPLVASEIVVQETAIPDRRTYFATLDAMQQVVQRVCERVVPELARLNAACISHRVQEQNAVTGMWRPFTPVDKALIAAYPLCTDWRSLTAERRRVRYAEANYRQELLKVIRGCVERGANVQVPAEDAPLRHIMEAYLGLVGHLSTCSRCLAPMAAKPTLMTLRLRWPRMQNRTLPDRCRECSTDAFLALELQQRAAAEALARARAAEAAAGGAGGGGNPLSRGVSYRSMPSALASAHHHNSNGDTPAARPPVGFVDGSFGQKHNSFGAGSSSHGRGESVPMFDHGAAAAPFADSTPGSVPPPPRVETDGSGSGMHDALSSTGPSSGAEYSDGALALAPPPRGTSGRSMRSAAPRSPDDLGLGERVQSFMSGAALVNEI